MAYSRCFSACCLLRKVEFSRTETGASPWTKWGFECTWLAAHGQYARKSRHRQGTFSGQSVPALASGDGLDLRGKKGAYGQAMGGASWPSNLASVLNAAFPHQAWGKRAPAGTVRLTSGYAPYRNRLRSSVPDTLPPRTYVFHLVQTEELVRLPLHFPTCKVNPVHHSE